MTSTVAESTATTGWPRDFEIGGTLTTTASPSQTPKDPIVIEQRRATTTTHWWPKRWIQNRQTRLLSASQSTSKLRNSLWHKSRNCNRLCMLLAIMCISVPYNTLTLYCYLKPFDYKTVPAAEQSKSTTTTTTTTTTMTTSINTTAEPEEIKCYELFEDVEHLLKNSRYYFEGVFLTLVGFIGLLGNTVSLLILRRDAKSSFDTLLIHLAVGDSMLVIFFLIDAICMLQNLEGPAAPTWYRTLYPYLFHPGKAVCVSMTVYMIVGVAADRQRAICHPMLYRPSPPLLSATVLFTAVFANFPKFFEFKRIVDDDGYVDYWTTDLNEDPRYILWSSYHELFASGVIPLAALCYYNYQIYARIKLSCFLDMGRFVGGGSTLVPSNTREEFALVNLSQAVEEKCCQTIERDCKSGEEQPRILLVSCDHPSHNKDYNTEPNSPNEIPLITPIEQEKSFPKPTLETRTSVTSAKSQQEDEDEALLSGNINKKQKVCKKPTAQPFTRRREKSTAILLGIILVFLSCHALRFLVQIYKVASSPLHGGQKLYQHCDSLDRLHVPALLLVCGNINHLLLVVNSSVNVIIYFCLGKRFRNQLRLLAGQCGNAQESMTFMYGSPAAT